MDADNSRNNLIKVRFFASLREQLAAEQVEIESQGIVTVDDVRQKLKERGPAWNDALDDSRILVAVNQAMARPSARVNAGDEVAFFPPVTGG